MMGDAILLILAVFGGTGLGVLFFYGLRLTIQHMQDVPSPVALMIASFLVRSVLVVIGFFIIYGGRLERLVGAMIGFLLARILLIRRLQFEPEQDVSTEEGESNGR